MAIIESLRNRIYGGAGGNGNPNIITGEGEKRLVKRVEDFFQKQQVIRRTIEIKWYEMMMAYLGNHYFKFIRNYNQFINYETNQQGDKDKNIKNRVRLTLQYPSSHIQSLLGKLNSGDINWIVKSTSQNTDDVEEAEIIEKVLSHYWRENELMPFDTSVQEADLWALICGLSWYHPYWNPDMGQYLQDYETIDVMDSQNLLSYEDKRPTIGMHEGNIDLCILSPFQLLISPVKYINEAGMVLKITLRHVDEIEEKYGVKVNPEDIRSVQMVNPEYTGADLSASAQNIMQGTSGDLYDGYCLVKEAWENPIYPEAKVITVANGKLLREIPFPEEIYGRRKFPFIPNINIRVPGRLTSSRSQLMDAFPLIRGLERSYNQAIFHNSAKR